MKRKEVFGLKRMMKSERGTTTVITLLIMFLLMGFVALALTRSSSETIAFQMRSRRQKLYLQLRQVLKTWL